MGKFRQLVGREALGGEAEGAEAVVGRGRGTLMCTGPPRGRSGRIQGWEGMDLPGGGAVLLLKCLRTCRIIHQWREGRACLRILFSHTGRVRSIVGSEVAGDWAGGIRRWWHRST